MNLQSIKTITLKWLKRIAITIVSVFLILIIIGILVWDKQKWNIPKPVNIKNIDSSKPQLTETNTSNSISSTGVINNTGITVKKTDTRNENTGSTILGKANMIETMSETDKKRIYWEYMTAQRKAASESLTLFPPAKQTENFKAYAEYENKLRDQYYETVAKNNKISRDQLDEIVTEANEKLWIVPVEWKEKIWQENKAKNTLLTEWIKKNEALSYVTCKNIIKQTLMSPSTADFPWTDFTVLASEWLIKVSSYVDSENSFWTKVRTNFTCKFDLKDNKLVFVDIGE